MIVSIIPARGGSKGIRYKNIVPFLGNPLISYTITQSLASKSVDRTFVSTDDEKITKVSERHGAEIIERPDEFATDEATTESALLHAIKPIRGRGLDPDVVVLLQCTSPLRREQDVDGAVELVTQGGNDSVLSVCEDHKFYWRDGDESAEPINYDPKRRKRRQELGERYQENGSIYVVRTETLETEECRLGGVVDLYQMPESHSFEIDDEHDLRLLESIGMEFEFFTGNLDVDYEAETTTEVSV